MRILNLLFVAVILSSCGSEPFQANKDNDYLAGKWTIITVDDADALVNKEAFFSSIINDNFKEGYIIEFTKGPNYKVVDAKGNESVSGKYAISSQNKVLKLQLPDEHVIEYDLISEEENKLQLNVTSAGEVVNFKLQATE